MGRRNPGGGWIVLIAAAHLCAVGLPEPAAASGGAPPILFSLGVKIGGQYGEVPMPVRAGQAPADVAKAFAAEYGLTDASVVPQLEKAIVGKLEAAAAAAAGAGAVDVHHSHHHDTNGSDAVMDAVPSMGGPPETVDLETDDKDLMVAATVKRAIREAAVAIFATVDTDADGVITYSEWDESQGPDHLRRAVRVPAELLGMFSPALFDLNNDGRFTHAEATSATECVIRRILDDAAAAATDSAAPDETLKLVQDVDEFEKAVASLLKSLAAAKAVATEDDATFRKAAGAKHAARLARTGGANVTVCGSSIMASNSLEFSSAADVISMQHASIAAAIHKVRSAQSASNQLLPYQLRLSDTSTASVPRCHPQGSQRSGSIGAEERRVSCQREQVDSCAR